MSENRTDALFIQPDMEAALAALPEAPPHFTATEHYRPSPEGANGVLAENAGNGTARSRLYLGDNLSVLNTLQAEFAGRIDFIYIDPPFCSGSDFRIQTMLSDDGHRQTVHQQTAFSDKWGNGTAGYLEWLFPRLVLMHKLLKPTGNFVIHLDWRAASHVRLLLDHIFGQDRLMNQLIWYKGFRGTRAKHIFQHAHDILWWYSKSPDYYWAQGFEPYKDKNLSRYNQTDENGRRYARIKRRRTDGTIYYGKTYPGERGKFRNDVLADIPTMAATARERTGFGTQKPLKLLSVLLESLCPPDGLAADFFCGTGTTLLAASRMGRHFLGADQSGVARHLTCLRLLGETGDGHSKCDKKKGSAVSDGLTIPDGFTVYRDEAFGRPDSKPLDQSDLLVRTDTGSLKLRPAAGDDKFIAFWAVDAKDGQAVFRPDWFSMSHKSHALNRESPAFPDARPLRIMVSARDGREWWFHT